MTYDEDEKRIIIDESDTKFMKNIYSDISEDDAEKYRPQSLYNALCYACDKSVLNDNEYKDALKALEDAKILEISAGTEDNPNACIAESMFADRGPNIPPQQRFHRIILDEGIRTVPESAFDGCRCAEINLPKSLTSIQKYAFASFACPEISMEKVRIAGCAFIEARIGSITMKDSSLLQPEAFKQMKSIKEINFGRIANVPDRVCDMCFDLKTVRFDPGCPAVIGEQAFALNYDLCNIDLSEVQEIDTEAFDCCKSLDVSKQKFKNLKKTGLNPFDGCKFSDNSITVSQHYGRGDNGPSQTDIEWLIRDTGHDPKTDTSFKIKYLKDEEKIDAKDIPAFAFNRRNRQTLKENIETNTKAGLAEINLRVNREKSEIKNEKSPAD